jgi:hypothetical protein
MFHTFNLKAKKPTIDMFHHEEARPIIILLHETLTPARYKLKMYTKSSTLCFIFILYRGTDSATFGPRQTFRMKTWLFISFFENPLFILHEFTKDDFSGKGHLAGSLMILNLAI